MIINKLIPDLSGYYCEDHEEVYPATVEILTDSNNLFLCDEHVKKLKELLNENVR